MLQLFLLACTAHVLASSPSMAGEFQLLRARGSPWRALPVRSVDRSSPKRSQSNPSRVEAATHRFLITRTQGETQRNVCGRAEFFSVTGFQPKRPSQGQSRAEQSQREKAERTRRRSNRRHIGGSSPHSSFLRFAWAPPGLPPAERAEQSGAAERRGQSAESLLLLSLFALLLRVLCCESSHVALQHRHAACALLLELRRRRLGRWRALLCSALLLARGRDAPGRGGSSSSG
jgi:hypothetical protein